MRRLRGVIFMLLAVGLLMVGSNVFGQAARKVTVGFSSPSLIGGQLDIQNSLVDPGKNWVGKSLRPTRTAMLQNSSAIFSISFRLA